MSNNTVWEYVIILSGLVVRRSRTEPMVLGSIPARKPVFFPSLLVNTFFFFTAIYSTKLKQQPVHALTAGLPLPLIAYQWQARGLGLTVICETKWSETKWKSVLCEMRICSLRNENPLEGERWLLIQREQRRRRRQQETAEQKEHRLLRTA